jgi:hypothetical protein
MSIFEKPQPQTLSEWLDIATKKLAAPTKKRIKGEIEAHYAQAMDDVLHNGSSESAASEAALAQLGDASLAARRFREHHLTEWESQIVQWSFKQARSVFAMALNCGIFAELALEQLPRRQNALIHYVYPLPYLVIEFLAMIALPTACFISARCIRRGTNMRLLLLMQSVSGFVVGLGLNQLFVRSPSQALFTMNVVMATFLCLRVVAIGAFALVVWNKLQLDRGAWSKPPPQDVALS